MDRLKVGIIGCGGIATLRHIPAFEKYKNKVEIVAVCDKNLDLAKKAAVKYHVANVFSDVSEMFSKTKLDIVDICTPPQTHAVLALEAIGNRCHVIMEKPMAISSRDCDDMIFKAKQFDVKLCIVHNQLFYPPMLKAKKLVDSGSIGEFIGMRIYMSDPRDEMIMKENYWIHKLPGGLLGETGPHLVYNSLNFIGKVSDIDIRARKFLEHAWAPFDEFRIELEGEKGNSSVLVSYPSNRRASIIDILGTEGALRLDLVSMTLIRYGENSSMSAVSVARYALGEAFQVVKNVTNNAYNFTTRKTKMAHEVVISGFIDSVLDNGRPPVTGEEGRDTVLVLEKIIEKLKQKYASYPL